MLPTADPQAVVITFSWLPEEQRELARAEQTRSRLLRVGGRASATLLTALVGAVPVIAVLRGEPLAGVAWTFLPWILLAGFWWFLASQYWRFATTAHNRISRNIPEERAVARDGIRSDGALSGTPPTAGRASLRRAA